jgi:hypothetical protein
VHDSGAAGAELPHAGAVAMDAAGEPPEPAKPSRFNIAPGKNSVNGVKVQCSAIATAPYRLTALYVKSIPLPPVGKDTRS